MKTEDAIDKKEFRDFEPVQINEEYRTVNETTMDIINSRLGFKMSRSQYEETQGLLKDILTEEIDKFREDVRKSLYGFESNVGIRHIIDYVSERYMVSFDDLQSKSRKQEIVEPRQVIHWMVRNHVCFNRLSLDAVGEMVGGRDHSTVLHSCKQINNWIATDRVFRERLMVMCNELGARTMWIPEKEELLVTGYYKRKQDETVSAEKTEQKELSEV
jgi:hypothetical protein